MQIILRTLIVAVCFMSFACQQQVPYPLKVTAPEGALSVRVNETPDSHELAFDVSLEGNSYFVADRIEHQLTKGGYVRCGSGGGKWEILRRREGGGETEETRLLRFFKTNDPNRLAVILATEQCTTPDGKCAQHFTVRQINVSQSTAGADKYIREICK